MAKAKNPVGRPRKIKSPAELLKLAQEYFDDCGETVLPNVTALALFVGLSGKEALWHYQDRDGFFHPVKACKARCEQAVIEWTAAGKIPPALGIFMMKNHGWSDRLDIAHSGEMTVKTGIAEVPQEDLVDAWTAEHGDAVEADTGVEAKEVN